MMNVVIRLGAGYSVNFRFLKNLKGFNAKNKYWDNKK
jgi:hypothetical protein